MYVQARERQRREEEERLAREAVEAERKLKEEEEARERAAQEAAEKQAALAKLREEKAQSLGEEPEKGPNVTQVKYMMICLRLNFLLQCLYSILTWMTSVLFFPLPIKIVGVGTVSKWCAKRKEVQQHSDNSIFV